MIQMGLRLPDFIIAGAPRSGTTWLYELLDRHPQIHMAKPVKPEPKFFLKDDVYSKGIQYYSDTWFKDAPQHCVLGEKSTNYLESSEVALRIFENIPSVKLIFILREPCHRAYSNYLWSRMNGLEDKSFAEAIESEDDREKDLPERLRFSRPYSYFSRGLYAKQLKPYFECFNRQQIICVRFEDVLDQPRQLAVCLHQFLAVEPRADDVMSLGVINPSQGEKDIPEEVLNLLRQRYLGPNQDLAKLLGTDFRVWDDP